MFSKHCKTPMAVAARGCRVQLMLASVTDSPFRAQEILDRASGPVIDRQDVSR